MAVAKVSHLVEQGQQTYLRISEHEIRLAGSQELDRTVWDEEVWDEN